MDDGAAILAGNGRMLWFLSPAFILRTVREPDGSPQYERKRLYITMQKTKCEQTTHPDIIKM
jgi:hypothetical protein